MSKDIKVDGKISRGELFTFGTVMGLVIIVFYVSATYSNMLNIKKLRMELKNMERKQQI